MSKTQAVTKIKTMGYMTAKLANGDIRVKCTATGETYYTKDGQDAVDTARLMQKRFLYAGDGMAVD